jgi:hypothetical protein
MKQRWVFNASFFKFDCILQKNWKVSLASSIFMSSRTSSANSSSNAESENIAWDQQICELQDQIAMLRNLINEVTERDWNDTIDKVQEIRNGMTNGKCLSDWCGFLEDYSGDSCSKTIKDVILQDYNCFRNIHSINTYSGVSHISTIEDVLVEMKFILEQVGEISGRHDEVCLILCEIWHKQDENK